MNKNGEPGNRIWDRLYDRRTRRAALLVASLVGGGLAVTSCANVVDTSKTASSKIGYCNGEDPQLPDASSGIKVSPSQYAAVLARLNSDLGVLRTRAVNNGGQIMYDPGATTGVVATRHGEKIEYNVTATDSAGEAGYTAVFGRNGIGEGAAFCNDGDSGGTAETDVAAVIMKFVKS